MQITEADLAIFIVYILFIVGLGLWVSRDKKGHQKDSKDYFLAGTFIAQCLQSFSELAVIKTEWNIYC